jgi:hypothetical protein
LSLGIKINGLSVAYSNTFSLKSKVRSGLTLNPASVSPVLKTKIEIQLESDFPYALAKGDFSVNVTKSDDSTKIKQLNVVEVDDASKKLFVMFGGAYSGTYLVSIRHAAFGLLGSEGLNLDVGSTVTAISPKRGSVNGGTLLTITGTNFGKELTDNPVELAYLNQPG